MTLKLKQLWKKSHSSKSLRAFARTVDEGVGWLARKQRPYTGPAIFSRPNRVRGLGGKRGALQCTGGSFAPHVAQGCSFAMGGAASVSAGAGS